MSFINRDLPKKIEFHTLLGSQGRVYVPKAIVERFELWEGTSIQVTMVIRKEFEDYLIFHFSIRLYRLVRVSGFLS